MAELRFPNPPAQPAAGERRTARPREDQGMPYTPATKRALRLSFAAHCDQRDKAGLPYVYHPFHLADQMPDEASACAALLHDVVEDGHLTFAQLEQEGIPREAVEAVRALTHDPSVPYLRYVLGLRTRPVAREVKLADLRHNANLARLDAPTATDRQRRAKYLMAQALLDDTHDSWNPETGFWRKRIPLDGWASLPTYYLSVFYRPDGVWDHLSLDVELAEDAHYVFDACHAEALRGGLGTYATLCEALSARVAADGVAGVLRVLKREGIPYKALHYD
jgi:hypothetical protein